MVGLFIQLGPLHFLKLFVVDCMGTCICVVTVVSHDRPSLSGLRPAVKVQHERLAHDAPADLWTLRQTLRFLEWAFPGVVCPQSLTLSEGRRQPRALHLSMALGRCRIGVFGLPRF